MLSRASSLITERGRRPAGRATQTCDASQSTDSEQPLVHPRWQRAARTACSWRFAALVAGAGLVLFADSVTPLGLTVWPGYLALMAGLLWTDLPEAHWLLASMGTLGITAGYFLSSSGIASSVGLLNRALGLALLWGGAAVVSAIKRRDSLMADQNRRLRRSEERARLIVEEVQEYAMFMLDPRGLVATWNKGAERITRYRAEEIIGKPLSVFYPEDDRCLAQRHLDTVLRNGRTEIQGWRLRRDGTRFWADVVMTAVRNENGALQGFVKITRDATERKRAEEAVNGARARLSAVLESAMDGIVTVDERGTIVLFNKAAEAMFRSPASDAVGTQLDRFIADRFRAVLRGRIHALGTSSRSGPSADRISSMAALRADGGEFPIEASLSRAVAEDRTLTTIMVRDLTELTRTRDALSATEERFRTLADHMAQLAWMADAEGRITWYNRRWYEYTGTTLEEMQERGWIRLVHSDHASRVAQRDERGRSEGTSWKDVFPLCDKHRNDRWFLFHALPVRDAAGRVTQWFATYTDVTQQRETEAALACSEERLRHVMDAAEIGNWDWYVRKGDLRWDERCVALFGLSSDRDLTYDRFLAVLHPADRDRVDRAVRQALCHGTPYEAEYRTRRRDGSERWVLAIGRAQRDEQGPVRMSGIALDITRRKEAEEALRRLTSELEDRVRERTADLEASNAALESFAHSVSHDLRAPLRTLQGFAQALMEDYAGSLPAEARDYARRISRGAQRMDGLITDLLAYNRLSRNALPIQTVSLRSVMREVEQQLDSVLRESGARLLVPEPLPCVAGHRATLLQVFSNLTANAVKFVAAGTPPVVRVTADRRGGWATVRVEDNGIGIEPEHRERIFNVFERLHGSDIYPGTGMGLAIVKKGVERMGGQVGVDSAPGKGSVFWVKLEERPC